MNFFRLHQQIKRRKKKRIETVKTHAWLVRLCNYVTYHQVSNCLKAFIAYFMEEIRLNIIGRLRDCRLHSIHEVANHEIRCKF